MNFTLRFIMVLTLDVVSALAARFSFNNESDLFLIIAMVSIAGSGYFFMQLIQERLTVLVNITWIALGAIAVTVASYLVFDESITLWQGLGMATILLGVALMEISSPNIEVE